MNIFDQYGIKEVADVTIYSIHKKEDGSGDVYYVPALYLDTLKVTTTEKTAENTWAQGGLGNSRLISWDYGKTINLTLEDALCTPASLGLCWGGILSADWKDGHVDHRTGMQSLDCSAERISRMEKAFYPRNDGTVVSELLPRDGKEDILEDFSGDKVFLQRSSILDGANVKGFGYLDGRPYKWHLEIESAVKSVAVVPDRFFSIYGKSYPIKRRQTVGINQPSEAFKYEIIYLRGYDKYNDETPCARIIYHKQMELGEETVTCMASDDADALRYLNDFSGYPYLKIRVCWDGSIRAYLGSSSVDWDLKRQIDDAHATPDTAWVEIPQINTDQFRDIDLWVRFDSLNALSYYLITKYENNIYNIAPKIVKPGIENNNKQVTTIEKEIDVVDNGIAVTQKVAFWSVPKGVYRITAFSDEDELYGSRGGAGPATPSIQNTFTFSEFKRLIAENPRSHDKVLKFTLEQDHEVRAEVSAQEAIWLALLAENGLVRGLDSESPNYTTEPVMDEEPTRDHHNGWTISPGVYQLEPSSPPYTLNIPLVRKLTDGTTEVIKFSGSITIVDIIEEKMVRQVVGLDYSLEDPSWVTEAENDNACTPCCKKDNMSRSIWAYVNPKTMTPFDDDYWFHQGEPYYKKSLTLSTGQNPLKAQKIFVEQGVFPGMYKIVAETLIRERDTGEDQRVQITLPLCKIKSDQTLTLQADGDPTTFNLDVEVATPKNGIPMEITFYEVEKDMKKGCSGNSVPKDGSTKISAKK